MTTFKNIDNNGIQMTLDTTDKSISIDPNNGLILNFDILTVNPKKFTMSSAGMNFLDNTQNNTTDLSRIALLQQGLSALFLPPNANTLEIIDTVLIQDIAILPTSISSLSAITATNPQLTLKRDTGGPVFEEADLTQNGLTYTTNVGGVSSATWANIIAGGGGVPSIDQVLAVGQNANNQIISNLNSIQIAGGTNLYNNSLAFVSAGGAITDLATINGVAYPPTSTANITDILNNGNNASGLNLTNLNNLDVITINSTPYPPSQSVPILSSVLASGDDAGFLNIINLTNLNTISINGTPYPPYPIAPYGLTQTLAYSNDGNGQSITNVSGIGAISGTFTISSQNSGAIDINSSYDTNMNGTGTFTINNGNGININSSNAIQIISSSGSISTQSNGNSSFYSNASITLEVVSGYIYLYGLPTSAGGPANSLYNAGGILMIN